MHALASGFTVIAVDLVGHGLSEKPRGSYTIAYFAEFLRRFLDALRIDRCHLVGHSLGGAVVLRFALAHPGRVAGIGLLDPAGLSHDLAWSLRLSSVPVLGWLLSLPSRLASRKLAESLVYDPCSVTREWVELIHRMRLRPGARAALLHTLRANVGLRGAREREVAPIRDRLHEIRSPVLLVWGREDRVIPVSVMKVARDGLSRLRCMVIADCGHVPHLEHPEECGPAMRAFFTACGHS